MMKHSSSKSFRDWNIKAMAFFLSFIMHGLFLLLPLTPKDIVVSKVSEKKTIPVQISYYEPVVEKVMTPKKIEKVKKVLGNDKTIAVRSNKPTSMPGDRPKPIIKSSRDPITPKQAMNENWKGKVVIDLVVNDKGKISNYKIVTSSGYPKLDNAFLKALKSYYEFKPKRVMGKDTTGEIRVSYEF